MEVADDISVEQCHQDHMYTFADYTTVWLEKVDRGGLFRISDVCYRLFYFIEMKVRVLLPRHLASPSSTKEAVLEAVENDKDVADQWNSVSSDIESRDLASSLLHEIASLRVTIRGFSLCAAWLEAYKVAKSKTTKKSKSLRNSIKQH